MFSSSSRRRGVAFLGLLLVHPAILSASNVDDGAVDLLHQHATEDDFSVVGRQQIEGNNQDSRDLVKASWREWPKGQAQRLKVVHNLCATDEFNWPKALNKARKQWNKKSQAVHMRMIDAGCNPRVNADRRFIPNAIHVVHGTCNADGSPSDDCCGKANVEYQFNGSGKITSYAVLVTLDPSCIAPGNSYGMQYLCCHELGHALGLGHDYGGGSCMGHYNEGKKPGRGDIATLLQLYGGNTAEPAKV